MKTTIVLLIASMASTTAFAIDGVYLGTPGYAGTGCRPGTASAILSPDAQQLSILFSDFVAEAGLSTGRQIDRKNCSIAVPVYVPQGYSVSILNIDYRGFNALPTGGRSTMTAEYFFAGSRGPVFSRSFYGPQNNDYLFQNGLVVSALVWSACGAAATLRANTSMVVQSNYQRDYAMATVDSADVSAALVYRLSWRRCY